MQTFIVLGNLTDQGRRTMLDSPARLDVAKAVLRQLGGNLKEFHLTMGQYDFVMRLRLQTTKRSPYTFSQRKRRGMRRPSPCEPSPKGNSER
jgi:hypothetical protein